MEQVFTIRSQFQEWVIIKKYRYKAKEFKNAEIISDNSIALPVGPHITEKNINYIFNQLKNILDKF